VATRWVGHCNFLYLADSVKYALALNDYDVTQHQPHPPGYALYIAAAKLISWLTHDPNLALIVVSILLSVGAILAVYYLAKKIYGSKVAWVAVLLLASAPVFWIHGQVALNYLSDALFSAWFGYLSYTVLTDKKVAVSRIGWATVVLAIGGGFRPTLVLFMLPLWLWMLYRSRSWRTIAANLTILAALTLSWLIPAAILSGGFVQFWQSVNALLFTPRSLHNFAAILQGVNVVWDHFNMMLKALLINFNLTAGALVIFLALLSVPRTEGKKSSRLNLYFWLALIVPAIVFYLMGIYTLPGYLLVIIPTLTILLAKTVVIIIETAVELLIRRPESRRGWFSGLLVVVTVLLVVGNCWIYLRPDYRTDDSHEPTYQSIRIVNRLWSRVIPTIKKEFNPQNTIIVIDQPFVGWGIEHFQYYLPEYEVYQRINWGIYNPEGKIWYRAYGQKFDLIDSLNILPSDTKMIMIRLSWSGIVTGGLQVVPLSGGSEGIVYYDLTDPAVRSAIAKTNNVKLIDSGETTTVN